MAAAQLAAEEIRREARLEQEDLREEARRSGERILEKARKQAVLLGADARREAEALIADAREESARTRQQTQRAVDGRVAAAEKAAADVLEEARALSGGLRQLGKSLEDYAERILRDVSAAHKRMQSDLRVGVAVPDAPVGATSADAEPSDASAPRSAPARQAVANARAGTRDGDRDGSRPRRTQLDDLEVPAWVGQRD